MREILFMMAIFKLFLLFPSAQTELAVKQYFEGQTVAVKMDMPGSSDGVDMARSATTPIPRSSSQPPRNPNVSATWKRNWTKKPTLARHCLFCRALFESHTKTLGLIKEHDQY